ncbi:MAG: glycosyltransferase [Actinomycetota bacterium]
MSAPGDSPRLAVLAPIFNDWACLGPFLADLALAQESMPVLDVFLVDDGSTDPMPTDLTAPGSLGSVEVLRLGTNLGHQRAIAAGLVEVAKRQSHSAVIVMDSDGEDRPSDVPVLYQAYLANPEAITVAQRQQRTEAVRFRLFYRLYKLVFRMLTGRDLDFGNFSLVPAHALCRLELMTELWNHYPATVMRSRVPINRVPLDRGVRYAGRSRMNFTSLVNHGLAGISAYIDTAFARLLATSVAIMVVLGLVTLGGVVLRLSTSVPIPGWLALGATAALIGVIQLIALLVVLSFVTLSSRSVSSPPPLETTPVYLVETLRIPQ